MTELQKGMRIQFHNLEDCEDKPPKITSDIEPNFGKSVIIKNVNSKNFEIEESDYNYHEDWIKCIFPEIPEELFVIEE